MNGTLSEGVVTNTTRGNVNVTEDSMRSFIMSLEGISDTVRAELLQVTPLSYVGYV